MFGVGILMLSRHLNYLFLSGVMDDFLFLSTFRSCRAFFKERDLELREHESKTVT
jgi:hypothetical protein